MARDIYVLDACALIAFFNDECGVEKVSQLFEEADLCGREEYDSQ